MCSLIVLSLFYLPLYMELLYLLICSPVDRHFKHSCCICSLSLVNFQCGQQESFYSFSSALMPICHSLQTYISFHVYSIFDPYSPPSLSLSSFPENHFGICANCCGLLHLRPVLLSFLSCIVFFLVLLSSLFCSFDSTCFPGQFHLTDLNCYSHADDSYSNL